MLVTYGILLRDTTRLGEIRWGLIVADEAQAVKNPESRGARALRELPAAARVALTGTPVENRLTDLWAILDWTTPGLLGHLEGFPRSIAVPIERYRDPDTTARFSRLIRPFLLRRKQDRSGHRAGAAAEDRDRPYRAADERTGHAVRGRGARNDGRDRGGRGNRAALAWSSSCSPR